MEMMEMHHNTNNRIFVIHELGRFSEHDNRTLSLRKNHSFIYLFIKRQEIEQKLSIKPPINFL